MTFTPMPKSTFWKYNIGSATYRFMQNKTQLILFLLSFTILSLVSILYSVRGTRKTYESLQGSKDCHHECEIYLNSQWFPLLANFPLSIFGPINIKGYDLVMNPNYQYYLCKDIHMREKMTIFRFIMPKVRSVAQQYYRLTRLDYGQANPQPLMVTYKGPGVAYPRKHQPVSTEPGVFELESKAAAGSSVIFEQIQNVDHFQMQMQEYKGCDLYRNSGNMTEYKYIAALYKRAGSGVPIEPLIFNFVRTVSYYDWQDWTCWGIIGLSGILLIETLVYVVFLCNIKRKGTARQQEWSEYVRVRQIQE